MIEPFIWDVFEGASMRIELIYTLVLTLICFITFLKMNEISEISSHKGIKSLRNSFLFFTLGFLIKIFARSAIINYASLPVSYNIIVVLLGVIFFTTYFNMLAIFYLINSLNWKTTKLTPLRFNLIALAIAIITVVTRIPWLYIIAQIVVLVYALKIIKSKHKKNSSFIVDTIYPLVLLAWFFNLLDLFIPSFMVFLQIMVYLSTIIIFSIILQRVLRSFHKDGSEKR